MKKKLQQRQQDESSTPACPLTWCQRPFCAKPLPHRFYHLMSTRDVVWPFISLSELSQHNKVRLRLEAMWHSHTRVGPSSSINLKPSKKRTTFLPNIIKSCCDLSHRDSRTVKCILMEFENHKTRKPRTQECKGGTDTFFCVTLRESKSKLWKPLNNNNQSAEPNAVRTVCWCLYVTFWSESANIAQTIHR